MLQPSAIGKRLRADRAETAIAQRVKIDKGEDTMKFAIACDPAGLPLKEPIKETLAELGIEVVVLDRPNPLGGLKVAG